MEMDTINVMIGMDKGKILLKERETILSFFFRAMTITIEAINLPMRVGIATHRTPRWRMNIPMKFPITLMAFINTETFIMTLVLPMALNMAVEPEYIPWKGQERAVTKRYIKEGLRDRAITRTLDWGVDVPFPGFEDKKIYVWIDAIMGYISASRKVAEERNET